MGNLQCKFYPYSVEKTRTCKISLPPIQFTPLAPSEGKNWLKPHSLLKEGHEKRKKKVFEYND